MRPSLAENINDVSAALSSKQKTNNNNKNQQILFCTWLQHKQCITFCYVHTGHLAGSAWKGIPHSACVRSFIFKDFTFYLYKTTFVVKAHKHTKNKVSFHILFQLYVQIRKTTCVSCVFVSSYCILIKTNSSL